jgi:hypothetical protein
VIHADEGVGRFPLPRQKRRIRRQRSFDRQAWPAGGFDRGNDNSLLLAIAKQAVLASVRIEAADDDLRRPAAAVSSMTSRIRSVVRSDGTSRYPTWTVTNVQVISSEYCIMQERGAFVLAAKISVWPGKRIPAACIASLLKGAVETAATWPASAASMARST